MAFHQRLATGVCATLCMHVRVVVVYIHILTFTIRTPIKQTVPIDNVYILCLYPIFPSFLILPHVHEYVVKTCNFPHFIIIQFQ